MSMIRVTTISSCGVLVRSAQSGVCLDAKSGPILGASIAYTNDFTDALPPSSAG